MRFIRFFRFIRNISKRALAECLILVVLAILISVNLIAQEKRDSTIIQDSAFRKIDTSRLTNFNSDSVKRYFISSDTLISYQLRKIEEYTLSLNQINGKLRRGFDTSIISKDLPITDSIISIVTTNLVGVKGHTSLKILSSTKNLLELLQNVLTGWQNDLSKYNDDLNSVKEQINLVNNDNFLFVMPADSLLFVEYIKKLKPLGQKINIADSNIALQFKKLGVIQNSVSSNYLEVMDLLEETNVQTNNFYNRILKKEFNYIWDFSEDQNIDSGFFQVIYRSVSESKTLLNFYIDTNTLSRLAVFLIGILFYFRMRSRISKIRKQSKDYETVLSKSNYITEHLLASSIVICLMMIPFVYTTAPQSYIQVIWGFQLLILGFLVRKKLNFTTRIQLLILLVLFYLTSFTNLLLETTTAERMIQLFISFVSVGLGIWLLTSKKRSNFLSAPFFRPLIILFLIMTASALLFNIFGRVTLAKILNTGAGYGVVEAINLLVFIEIIIDAIYLSLEAGKNNKKFNAYVDFVVLEKRLRKVFGVIALIIWILFFTQNLHMYDSIYNVVSDFLSKMYEIGDISFSFGSISIFVIVVWLSTLISQLISFIFSEQEKTLTGQIIDKNGSTMLLVRIGILSAGVLLAFGASGIPLDKLAIIVGALGVGIGFGLQTIVNNLVSGIVLAFEKPIQIGDVIEVGDKGGTVKEIGIRSSTLTTFDGSELIIPNGDMLSQHLINWTRNSSARRITVSVGVAYGSDIVKVNEVIMRIINEKADIFNFPTPNLRVMNFGDNSVDLNVYFWADNSNWLEIKSDVMASIYKSLNEEGIEIPFPQRDLHIRSVDENLLSKISKKDEGGIDN